MREGQLDPADVDTHPQRHILTRAVGILPDVDVDVWEVLPLVGDRIVLCSDGLVRELTDDQIAAVLRRLDDAKQAAQELVARARAAGGADNITVIVVDVVDDDDRVRIASHEAAETAAAPDVPATAPTVQRSEAASAPRGGGTPVTFPKMPKRRRVTWRVVVFIVLVIVVLAGAGYAVVAYARDSYYVTLGKAGSATPSPLADQSSQPIVIYKRRPGGSVVVLADLRLEHAVCE